MTLLIDGYNLIYAVGLGGIGVGDGHLERARRTLLDTLAERLHDAERSRTLVVFDARLAPPGRPDQWVDREMTVRFARKYRDADELLIELIDQEPAPVMLTVVSSDHAIQRAARRRRATAVDSEPWFDELLRRRQPAPGEEAAQETEPDKPKPSADDAAYWLEQFQREEVDPPPRNQRRRPPPPPRLP